MAETVKEQLVAAERTLDRELSKHPVFLRLERATGQKKTTLVGLAVASIVTFFLLRMAADILLAVVAFAYPAIMTVTAIEKHDKAEDTHWLSYWLVLAFWSMMESLTGGLFSNMIPMYSVVKLAICVWLFLPQTRGATTVYEKVVRPLALTARDHPTVKDAMSRFQRGAEEASKVAGKSAKEIKESANEALKTAEKVNKKSD